MAKATPSTVVVTETTTELKSQWPNSQRPAKSCAPMRLVKLSREKVSGRGLAESENACEGVNAIFTTHKTG